MVLNSFDVLLKQALSAHGVAGGNGVTLWHELAARTYLTMGGQPELAAVLGQAVHTYFVAADVLDDIEDNDGIGALWQSAGPGPAVNAGSGLLLLALHSLLNIRKLGIPGDRVLRMARFLTGAGLRACRGQHIDLTEGTSERMTLPRYYRVINLKAGSLVAAACATGALGTDADGEAVKLIASFGLHLGISLQIANDSRSLLQHDHAKNDWGARKRTIPLLFALRKLPPPSAQRLSDLMGMGYPGAREEALAMVEVVGGFAFADSVRRAEMELAGRRLQALHRHGVDTSLLQEVIRSQ